MGDLLLGSYIHTSKILRYVRGVVSIVDDEVVVEIPIHVYVNSRLIAILNSTPVDLEALAIGYLITEGFLRDLSEVSSISISESNHVYVKTSTDVEYRVKLMDNVKVVGTICGEYGVKPARKVNSDAMFTVDLILDAVRRLSLEAQIYRRTGGAHIALILDDSGFTVQSEDVGRHNAVDKVIGLAFLKNYRSFEKSMLACSGRISSEIVRKAASVGIPLIASPSAPTSLGLRLAEQSGLTIVGFVRGYRFNVYTYPHRIAF
jgi:FdhD protein